MNEETAWGHFAATGSVADYLSYCQARKEEEARALGNGRPGDPGKAGGESDRLVTILTRHDGVVRAFCPSCQMVQR